MLSKCPCTGMIDGLRVDVMSCVCYDWFSVGAGTTVRTATGWILTDSCTLPDIHNISPSFGSQFVHRDTSCALQETLKPDKCYVTNNLTSLMFKVVKVDNSPKFFCSLFFDWVRETIPAKKKDVGSWPHNTCLVSVGSFGVVRNICGIWERKLPPTKFV